MEACEKCGEPMEVRWPCATHGEHIHKHMPGSPKCLMSIKLNGLRAQLRERDEQLAAAKGEQTRTRSELSALIGYVSTCRSENQPAWMEGLVEAINEAQASIGDPDRVSWDKHADWIDVQRATPAESESAE